MVVSIKGVIVTIDDKPYEFQPIRAGQMRDMEKRRKGAEKSGEILPFTEDNLFLVRCCLENSGAPISPVDVENLPYPIYKQLLEVAQRISGFEEKKSGEGLAP